MSGMDIDDYRREMVKQYAEKQEQQREQQMQSTEELVTIWDKTNRFVNIIIMIVTIILFGLVVGLALLHADSYDQSMVFFVPQNIPTDICGPCDPMVYEGINDHTQTFRLHSTTHSYTLEYDTATDYINWERHRFIVLDLKPSRLTLVQDPEWK